MQNYCGKCKTKQIGLEKVCSNCGAPYGGEIWPILGWFVLVVLVGPVFILDGRFNELKDIMIVFWYLLPVTLLTAILYDHHPKRCSFYFWGGAAVIVSSLFMLR